MKMSDIVKETTEMTSASVATSIGGGGFLNGIGDEPIKRVTKPKKKSKAKKKA